MTIHFTCKTFDQLSSYQLYDILALRCEVFIVEQNCPYIDTDYKDQQALHLMGYSDKGQLLAYARLLPKGVSYEKYSSIGRVVTSPSIRGMGHGQPLMKRAIEMLKRHFGSQPIKISAQQHLIKYYTSLGFKAIGEPYLEDDIPHIAMLRDVTE